MKSAEELKELLINYAPNKQIYLCKDKSLCFFGDIPTLSQINRDYDKMAAVAWLVPQLTNLAEFSNCKTSFGKEQIRSCAEMIVAEYHYMKITELMFFFYRFKNGEYGQFYGSVSPMVIMGSLKQFRRERNDILFQHESLIEEKRREEAKKGAVSAEEYYASRIKSILDYFNAIVRIISLTLKKQQQ